MSPRIADPIARPAARRVVSIAPDDLDHVEDLPAAKAIGNLAHVHQLPRLEHVYRVDAYDGRTVVLVAVPQAAAECWRAALGAPPFSARSHPTSRQHTTEVFWFGATVRLSYSTYV